MKEIPLPEGLTRKEWLALRREGIGGSDASVACGMNPYRSPLELWMEKTGQTELEEGDSEAAYWGSRMEPIIREEFSERTGLSVSTRRVMLQHDSYPYMLANLDGIVSDANYGPCIFEAKTASAFKASHWHPEIPLEYALQLYHYMEVTGYQGAYIAVLIGGNQFLWKFVPRDASMISMLLEKEAAFWECVTENRCPPMDGSEATGRALEQLYPKEEEGSQLILPDEARSVLHQYDDALKEERSAREKKEQAINLLKQQLGTHEKGVIGTREIRWKTVTSKRFQTKAFQEQFPKDYEKFLACTESRRFSIQ